MGYHDRTSTAEKIAANVDTSGGPDACHPWTGEPGQGGYGKLWVYIDGKRKSRRAHRIVYEMQVDPIPAGKLLRHTCDNPPCCNVRHLVPGTHAQNRADAVERGRVPRGEAHGRALLGDVELAEMRAAYQPGVRGHGAASLAKRYGVSVTQVKRLLKNKNRAPLIDNGR